MAKVFAFWGTLIFVFSAGASVSETTCHRRLAPVLNLLDQYGIALPLIEEIDRVRTELGPNNTKAFDRSLEDTRFRTLKKGHAGHSFQRVITLNEVLRESPYLQIVFVHELDHFLDDFEAVGHRILDVFYKVNATFRAETRAEARVWEFIRRNYQKSDLPRLHQTYIQDFQKSYYHSWYAAGLMDPAAHGITDKNNVFRRLRRYPNDPAFRSAAVYIFNQNFYETIASALELDQKVFSVRTLSTYENQNTFGNIFVGLVYGGHVTGAYFLAQALGWIK
jgi:hypothetical protein